MIKIVEHMGKSKSNKTLKQNNRISEIKTNQDFNGQQPSKEQLKVKVEDPNAAPRTKRFKKKNKEIFNADNHFDDDAQD